MVTIKELAGGALPLLRGRPTSSLHHPKKRFVPFHFSMNGHYLYLALPPHKSLMQSQNQRGQYLLLKQCSPHLQGDTVMSTNHFNPKCTKLMFTCTSWAYGALFYTGCGVCRHRVLTRPVNRLWWTNTVQHLQSPESHRAVLSPFDSPFLCQEERQIFRDFGFLFWFWIHCRHISQQ